MADKTHNQHTAGFNEHEMEQIRFEADMQEAFEARQREYDDERPEDAAQDEQWAEFADLYQHNQHVDDYELEQCKRELAAEG